MTDIEHKPNCPAIAAWDIPEALAMCNCKHTMKKYSQDEFNDKLASMVDAAVWQGIRCELAGIYLKLSEHCSHGSGELWTLDQALEWLDDRCDKMDAEMTHIIDTSKP